MKPTRQTYRIVTRLCREAGRLEKALEVGPADAPCLLNPGRGTAVISVSLVSVPTCPVQGCSINPLGIPPVQVYRGMRARKFKPSNAEFRELTSACAEQALKEGHSSALPSKARALTCLPSLAINHPLLNLGSVANFITESTLLAGSLQLEDVASQQLLCPTSRMHMNDAGPDGMC